MNTMKMPASYNVMNEEEMTYTDGGFSIYTAINLASTALSIYNEVWAAPKISSFVKEHKNEGASAAINAAMDQFTAYVQKDIPSAVVGVYSVCNQLFWWPVTTVYCLVTAA